MATAKLIYHSKRFYNDGGIVELKIWVLPKSILGSTQRLKYSLYYGRGGLRLVGYDNDRGKGDHRHYGDREEAYPFISMARLLADFEADVNRLRHTP